MGLWVISKQVKRLRAVIGLDVNLFPHALNIVEQAHAQLRRRNHGHHGRKDGSKARQFCVWLIVRAYLSFGEITLFPPRTSLRVISCLK